MSYTSPFYPFLDQPVTVIAEQSSLHPFNCQERYVDVEGVGFQRPLFTEMPTPVPLDEKKLFRSVGDLKVDFARIECFWKDQEVKLTRTELLVLESLTSRPGYVVSRNAIIDRVFGEGYYVTDRTVDSHVKRIRKKFRQVDPGFAGIRTHYGFGYCWAEMK